MYNHMTNNYQKREPEKPKGICESLYDEINDYMQKHAFSTCGMAAGAGSSLLGALAQSPGAVLGGVAMVATSLVAKVLVEDTVYD